jgi:hypothetical protein
MLDDESLDSRLNDLGRKLSPAAGFTSGVMGRLRDAPVVAPSRTMKRSLAALAASAVIVGLGWRGAPSALFNQQPALYATELADVVRTENLAIAARETYFRTLSNGETRPATTSSMLYLSRDAYRRDIFDGQVLRETQWYLGKGNQTVQTSVRHDTKKYSVVVHPSPFTREDPRIRFRNLVNQIKGAHTMLPAAEWNGQRFDGFETRSTGLGGKDEGAARVWFDSATRLPVRIETLTPRGDEVLHIVDDQFQWGVEHPDAFFRPEIPAQYQEVSEVAEPPLEGE